MAAIRNVAERRRALVALSVLDLVTMIVLNSPFD